MSYDYLLIRGPADATPASIAEAIATRTIGYLDDVKEVANRLFPSIVWKVVGGRNPIIMGIGGPAEIQLTTDSRGDVTMISLSHAGREEVSEMARCLNLLAFDEQSLEALSN